MISLSEMRWPGKDEILCIAGSVCSSSPDTILQDEFALEDVHRERVYHEHARPDMTTN